jgi:hypothetical protein
MGFIERLHFVKLSAPPLMHDLHIELKTQLPNGQSFVESVYYTLKCWSGLTQNVENGHIPIDNNGAENSIRPFVIGSKNWMFCDSVSGAHASARLYSIIETAKAKALEP